MGGRAATFGDLENIKATSAPQAWAAPPVSLLWDFKVSGDAEPTQQQWSGAGEITRLTAWALADIWFHALWEVLITLLESRTSLHLDFMDCFGVAVPM